MVFLPSKLAATHLRGTLETDLIATHVSSLAIITVTVAARNMLGAGGW